MTAIAKRGTPQAVTQAYGNEPRVGSGLICGEDLAAGDACYIKIADGLVYRSTGAAANAAAEVVGYAATACKVAQKDAVTLFDGLDWAYTTGQFVAGNVGKPVYLSGTVPGGIDTAASTGGTGKIGRILDDGRVRLWASTY